MTAPQYSVLTHMVVDQTFRTADAFDLAFSALKDSGLDDITIVLTFVTRAIDALTTLRDIVEEAKPVWKEFHPDKTDEAVSQWHTDRLFVIDQQLTVLKNIYDHPGTVQNADPRMTIQYAGQALRTGVQKFAFLANR